MKEDEIREGDIVEIDYIREFTKEHIDEGKALVIWKGNYHQPLVRELNTKKTIWTCYEHIARVIGHIDIEGYMDKALEQEPKTGHWKSFTRSAYHGIDDDGEPIWREVKVYHCNLCNRRTVIKENYCPNCGCRMVEPQESEDKE